MSFPLALVARHSRAQQDEFAGKLVGARIAQTTIEFSAPDENDTVWETHVYRLTDGTTRSTPSVDWGEEEAEDQVAFYRSHGYVESPAEVA